MAKQIRRRQIQSAAENQTAAIYPGRSLLPSEAEFSAAKSFQVYIHTYVCSVYIRLYVCVYMFIYIYICTAYTYTCVGASLITSCNIKLLPVLDPELFGLLAKYKCRTEISNQTLQKLGLGCGRETTSTTESPRCIMHVGP